MSIIFIYPLVGIKLSPSNGDLCTVSEVYKNGWANYNNIKRHDLIYFEQATNSAFKLEKVDQIFVYTNQQKKESKIVSYKDMPISYLIYSFFPILYFVIGFSTTLYLFFKNRSDKLTVITAFLLLFISLSYLSSGVSSRGDVFGLFITTLSLYLIPILLLEYLDAIILEEHQRLTSIRMKYLYGFTIIIATVNALFDIAKLILIFFLLLILFVSFLFIKHYQTIKKSTYFVKMKLFFWTIVFSLLPFIFFSAIPEILLGEPLILAEDTALFLLLIPLALAYVTVQKVVFDFDFFIKKFMINFSLSLAPGLVLAGILYMKEDNSLHAFQFLLFSITLIIIILFLKDHFFLLHTGQGKFQTSIHKYSQASNQINDVQALFLYIKQLINDVLQIDNTKIVHYHLVHKYFCIERTIEEQSWLRLLKKPWSIGNVRELDRGYALLVGKSSSIYTFITFPYKRKMMKLNKEEKDWLMTIAHYTNLMLENFKKTDDLLTEMQNTTKTNHSSTISRTLFLLGEKERGKLAQDIHDSILQELITLNQNIEFIQNSDDSSINAIEKIKIQVHEQIGFIRDACYDLNPPFLIELGLLESISILLDKYRKSNEFDIYFQGNTPKQYAHLDEETTIILYRTVQELMNNAKKHSEAKYINISLSYSRNHFVLIYEDDGVGFDFQQQSEHVKHFGLFNIHERIKSIHGEIFINSKPGQGLLFRATIPNNL